MPAEARVHGLADLGHGCKAFMACSNSGTVSPGLRPAQDRRPGARSQSCEFWRAQRRRESSWPSTMRWRSSSRRWRRPRHRHHDGGGLDQDVAGVRCAPARPWVGTAPSNWDSAAARAGAVAGDCGADCGPARGAPALAATSHLWDMEAVAALDDAGEIAPSSGWRWH